VICCIAYLFSDNVLLILVFIIKSQFTIGSLIIYDEDERKYGEETTNLQTSVDMFSSFLPLFSSLT